MAETKPFQVFLTYAREDRPIVLKLYDRLQASGFMPWMDVNDIRGGERWDSAIAEAINNSNAILICFSSHTVSETRYVQTEIRYALEVADQEYERDKYIIPVRLDNSPIPASLRKWQFVDLSTDVGIDKLIQSLKNRAKQLGLDESQIQEVIKQDKKPKKQVFVAMPFSAEMEDTFYYGIQRAVDVAGFNCYRSDKVAYVGDILQEIKKELDSSVAVVADLTDSNPNVYLEVGFAWGKGKPTVLIMKQGNKLRFDVQGQKCLHDLSIRNLEEILTKELQELKAKDIIQ